MFLQYPNTKKQKEPYRVKIWQSIIELMEFLKAKFTSQKQLKKSNKMITYFLIFSNSLQTFVSILLPVHFNTIDIQYFKH